MHTSLLHADRTVIHKLHLGASLQDVSHVRFQYKCTSKDEPTHCSDHMHNTCIGAVEHKLMFKVCACCVCLAFHIVSCNVILCTVSQSTCSLASCAFLKSITSETDVWNAPKTQTCMFF